MTWLELIAGLLVATGYLFIALVIFNIVCKMLPRPKKRTRRRRR